jgi:hypothetical protein
VARTILLFLRRTWREGRGGGTVGGVGVLRASESESQAQAQAGSQMMMLLSFICSCRNKI